MLKYKIRNNFQSVTGETFTASGSTATGPVTFGGTEGISEYKSIVIPINMNFFPVDYGDDVQDIVLSERKKAINPTFDAETTKYTYNDNVLANSGQGLILQFRFWNSTASTFNTSYTPAGITDLDINKRRNGFKKSFFRLYFYDTNSGDTNQLIFTEDLDIDATTQPIIPLNRLYWLRNDEYFLQNNNNRIVYMEASFFNAKTGKVQRFINPPAYITTPLTIAQYSNLSNRSWRTSAIELINPKLNNGGFNFRPSIPFGANNPTVITLTEFIMT